MKSRLAGYAIGIYEKALPARYQWRERLSAAKRLGFDFLEMSIDPSPEKLARLDWSAEERREMRHCMDNAELPIRSICLSAHRHSPLGSSDKKVRARGLQIMAKSIELAQDLRVRLIQVAGYDTDAEPSTVASRTFYEDGIAQAAIWASQAGVLLGLENQEVGYVDSISTAVEIVRKVHSPYLGLYSDMGNLVIRELDVESEIQRAHGLLFGVHLKDVRLGQPRKIPFGEGLVPFDRVFEQLMAIDFFGPITIEMWNEDLDNPEKVCEQALVRINEYLEKAWYSK